MLAYVTSGFSKAATVAVQILALPVVSASLGHERLGALLVLGSISSILTIPGQGLAPSASFSIAHARGIGDNELIAREFWGIFVLAALTGLFVGAAGLTAALLIDPLMVISAPSKDLAGELKAALLILTAHVVFYYFFTFTEGVRAAFQENHVTNIFGMSSSICALAAVAISWKYSPSIPAFYFSIFALPPLIQSLNLAAFLWRRRNYLGKMKTDRAVVKSALSRAASFSKAQLGLVLNLHGSVYVAGQLAGMQAGALIGGMVRLFVLAHSTVVSILNPVLPTISHAMASQDSNWIVKTVWTLYRVTLVGVLSFSILICTAGSVIIEKWLGLEVPNQPALFAALGLVAFCYMISHMQYLVLLALGDGVWGSRRLLMAGVVGLAGGIAMLQRFDLTGLIAAQGVAMLLLGLIPMSFRLIMRVRQNNGQI